MSEPFAPLLARIDDRLIHGQVVVGCCEPLGARDILLVDDAVAGDSLQQKLYRAAVPPEVTVRFTGVDGARELIEATERDRGLDRLIVVAAHARTMDRLRRAGIAFRCIQLGGAHARQGTRELLPGIFLDREDLDALRALVDSGAEVFVQPVAAAASQPLSAAMLAEVDS